MENNDKAHRLQPDSNKQLNTAGTQPGCDPVERLVRTGKKRSSKYRRTGKYVESDILRTIRLKLKPLDGVSDKELIKEVLKFNKWSLWYLTKNILNTLPCKLDSQGQCHNCGSPSNGAGHYIDDIE